MYIYIWDISPKPRTEIQRPKVKDYCKQEPRVKDQGAKDQEPRSKRQENIHQEHIYIYIYPGPAWDTALYLSFAAILCISIELVTKNLKTT